MKVFLRFVSLVTGCFLILLAIAFSATANSSNITQLGGYFHLTSFSFIILILLGVCLISYGIENILTITFMVLFSNPGKVEKQMRALEKQFQVMGDAYYEGGPDQLQEQIKLKKLLPVWQVLVQQLQAKVPLDDIQGLLDRNSFDYKTEINQKIKNLQTISMIAPSLGVLGTVLGLVKLLANLKDVASIGPNMSLALITTLYGIFIGTVLLKPAIHRLEAVRNVYLKSYRQATFWLELIKNRKPSFYVNMEYSKLRRGSSRRKPRQQDADSQGPATSPQTS